MQENKITIEILPADLSVCKVEDYSDVDFSREYVFTARTDEEFSLVCPTEIVPKNTLSRVDGWRAMRIVGQLDFSLVGILSRIASILADEKISIFAISTFNTDYILVKSDTLEKAVLSLTSRGYMFV